MAGSLRAALAGALLVTGGCAELWDQRVAPCLIEAVQIAHAEPGPTCRALGPLEGSSDEDLPGLYDHASESLRRRAAQRGGNYVVVDCVHEPQLLSDGRYEHSTSISGRLFACGSPAARACTGAMAP